MKTIKLIYLLTITLTITMSLQPISHSEPLALPGTYSGIDDMLIPDPPFKYTSHWQEYIFKPLIFLNTETEELELNHRIIITPYIPIHVSDTNSLPNVWVDYVKNNKEATIQDLQIQKAKIAGKPAYQLTMRTNDYRKKGDKKQYFETTYLVKLSEKQIAGFTSSRLYENKNNNKAFGPYWKQFLESIQVVEPNPYSASILTDVPMSRKYYFDNIVAIIPTGTKRGLYKWKNKQNAERIDHWHTPEGKLTIKYSIISGYDFDAKSKNEKYALEVEALVKGGADFFKQQGDTSELSYEDITTLFSKNSTIYGYREKSESYSEIGYKIAYKTGKALHIEINTSNQIAEKYQSLLDDWFKHFVILPDT